MGWPLSPLTLRGGPLFKVPTVTPRGVCVCNCLGFVSFRGPTHCVVGGCAPSEWWGVAVVCVLCIVRGRIRRGGREEGRRRGAQPLRRVWQGGTALLCVC
eukprot:scaffold15002_cov131-Isochrysis_galbana.AAC.10